MTLTFLEFREEVIVPVTCHPVQLLQLVPARERQSRFSWILNTTPFIISR